MSFEEMRTAKLEIITQHSDLLLELRLQQLGLSLYERIYENILRDILKAILSCIYILEVHYSWRSHRLDL